MSIQHNAPSGLLAGSRFSKRAALLLLSALAVLLLTACGKNHVYGYVALDSENTPLAQGETPGKITLNPANENAEYDKGAKVTASYTVNPGFAFTRWTVMISEDKIDATPSECKGVSATCTIGTEDGMFAKTQDITAYFKRVPIAPTPTPLPPTPTSVPPTPTPVPPTATATPVPPAATATPVPPAATATPVPPTATATPVPPVATATPIPPTATPTRTPTPTLIPSTPTATPAAGTLPVQACNGQPGVQIYVDIDFGGACLRLTSDVSDLRWFTAPTSGGTWDNNLSSIKVIGGYKATLYVDYNFTGPSEVITADDTFVNTTAGNTLANDSVSSIKVTAP